MVNTVMKILYWEFLIVEIENKSNFKGSCLSAFEGRFTTMTIQKWKEMSDNIVANLGQQKRFGMLSPNYTS